MTNSSVSKGVVYIAGGQAYIDEAKKSATSLKEHNPDLPITIFADRSVDYDIFDDIIRIEGFIDDPGDSILTPDMIQYDLNLYLDTDTYICSDIEDVFDVLDRSDIGVAHNPGRNWWAKDVYDRLAIDIPDSFPEYNTGVVAYRDSEPVRELFDNWKSIYHDLDHTHNQPAFRATLYRSDLNIATLPQEYNFMVEYVGFASGKVKILHAGSSPRDLSEFERVINDDIGRRVITWEEWPCRVIPNSQKRKRDILRDLLSATRRKQKYEGTASVIRTGIEMISDQMRTS